MVSQKSHNFKILISTLLILSSPAKRFFSQEFDHVIGFYDVCSPSVALDGFNHDSYISLNVNIDPLNFHAKYECANKVSRFVSLLDSINFNLFALLDSKNLSLLTYPLNSNVTYFLCFQPKTQDYNYEYIEYIYSVLSTSHFSVIFSHGIKNLGDLKAIIRSEKTLVVFAQSANTNMLTPVTVGKYIEEIIEGS